MYEYLKNLFGKNEDGTTKPMTADELEKAITDAGLKVFNLDDGDFISKEKHTKTVNAKNDEIKTLQGSLDKANEQIQSFKDMDVESIKNSVDEWKTKYETETAALKKQMEDNRKSYAEDLLMSEYEFTSKAAKNGILAELRKKDFKVDDDGSLLGAREYIEKLKEDEDYKGAFKAAEADPGATKPRFTAQSTGGSVGGGAGGAKMTLAEAMIYKNAHPDADVSKLI